MDIGLTRTLGLAAITAVLAVFVAQADPGPAREAAGTVAPAASATSKPAIEPRWIADANALALLSMMNARQLAAAQAELQAWRSDTVRALAVSIAQLHAGLQHDVDSVAQQLQLAPATPAMASDIVMAMQAQIDSMTMLRGDALDRAYVAQQIASHERMTDYLDQLSTIAERPEVQALMSAAAGRSAAALARAKAVQAMFVVSDSVAADSVAADSAAARRERSAKKRRAR